MSKHIVSISDEDGKAFKITVSIGFLGSSIGSWHSLEVGRIRYTQGKVLYMDETEGFFGSFLSRHILLFDSPQSQNYGMRLNDYYGFAGVNDQGMGYLYQPWVLDFKPYRISWALMDWEL
ncbi:MAG: hypothetical protein K1X72_28795 [Pyrinomonadaceae bacterium]|nr:hypothetical protein [Pyrinomonadaceae bacterium]